MRSIIRKLRYHEFSLLVKDSLAMCYICYISNSVLALRFSLFYVMCIFEFGRSVMYMFCTHVWSLISNLINLLSYSFIFYIYCMHKSVDLNDYVGFLILKMMCVRVCTSWVICGNNTVFQFYAHQQKPLPS